jgi:hypothetical protein
MYSVIQNEAVKHTVYNFACRLIFKGQTYGTSSETLKCRGLRNLSVSFLSLRFLEKENINNSY